MLRWGFCALILFALPAPGFAAHVEVVKTIDAGVSAVVPPDSMGAVGPDHYVMLLNGTYAVYRKCDGAQLLRTTLNDFWLSTGVTDPKAFDPRILYDSASQRWFAVCCSFDYGYLLFGVSKGADPLRGWHGFKIAAGTPETYCDFARIGMDAQAVYLAPSFGGRFVLIPKADLLIPTPTVSGAGFMDHPGSFPLVSLDGTTMPATFYQMNSPGNFWTRLISGSPAAPVAGPVRYVLHPLIPGDVRITCNVPMRFGLIWTVGIAADAEARRGLHWAKWDPNQRLVVQEVFIREGALRWSFPSIAVNDYQDVVIGCNGTDAQNRIGNYAFIGRTRNGVTEFDPEPVVLKEGAAPATGRWGDYSATTVDPSDPYRFWTIQEWSSGVNVGSLQIAELAIDGATPRVSAVLSRQAHAGAGSYDINLLAGDTECRQDGVTQLVIRFDMDVQAEDGSFDAGDEFVLSAGTFVSTPRVQGREITLDVSGLTAGCAELHVTGVASARAPGSVLDTRMTLAVLRGDAVSNHAVTACDPVAIRSALAAPVTAQTCRFDLDSDGIIGEIDATIAESALGTQSDCATSPPDPCEACSIGAKDCNQNGRADACDITDGFSHDWNVNGLPDECEPLKLVSWRTVKAHAGVGDLGIDMPGAAAGAATGTDPRSGGANRIAIRFTRPSELVDVPRVEDSLGNLITITDYRTLESGYALELLFDEPLGSEGCYRIELAQAVVSLTDRTPLRGDTDCMIRILEGDLDSSGRVDGVDAALLSERIGLAVAPALARFDLNADGSIDAHDQQVLIGRMGGTAACGGDADGDGVADTSDACPNTISGATVDASGCPPVVPGDADRDGDVDPDDVGAFIGCASGPAVACSPDCIGHDHDGDRDVDLDDYGVLQRCFSGAGRPARAECGS